MRQWQRDTVKRGIQNNGITFKVLIKCRLNVVNELSITRVFNPVVTSPHLQQTDSTKCSTKTIVLLLCCLILCCCVILLLVSFSQYIV